MSMGPHAFTATCHSSAPQRCASSVTRATSCHLHHNRCTPAGSRWRVTTSAEHAASQHFVALSCRDDAASEDRQSASHQGDTRLRVCPTRRSTYFDIDVGTFSYCSGLYCSGLAACSEYIKLAGTMVARVQQHSGRMSIPRQSHVNPTSILGIASLSMLVHGAGAIYVTARICLQRTLAGLPLRCTSGASWREGAPKQLRAGSAPLWPRVECSAVG